MRPPTESRRETRFECDHPVQVTILNEPGTRFAGQLSDFSLGGLCLRVEWPISEGTLVKVEFDEMLLLGEVRYCQPVPGGCQLGLKLEHSLACTEDLLRLAREIQH